MKKIIVSIGLLLFSTLTIFAQESFDKAEVVNRLAEIMNENYVFPDKGKAMHDLIKSKLQKGEYDEITTADALAGQLDADLKSIIYDKHIRVRFSKERVNAIQNREPGGGAEEYPITMASKR